MKFDFINDKFKSVERIQNIEFNRDWNIETISGNQKLLSTSINLSNQKHNSVNYQFENLEFSDSFKGNKHHLYGRLNHKNISIQLNSSILNNEAIFEKGTFSRYSIINWCIKPISRQRQYCFSD